MASYRYDPFGRRISKTVNGETIYFLYSPQGLIGEYTATGSLIRGYGYNPGGHWMTDPLYLKTGSTREQHYFYQNDHLGTPQKLMSTTGAIVWDARYEAFGQATPIPLLPGVQPIDNPLRFAGQYLDPETGWHYNWHRYYSPELGRYITEDPIGLAGGLNPYNFVASNPIKFQDPHGLDYTIEQGCGIIKINVTIFMSQSARSGFRFTLGSGDFQRQMTKWEEVANVKWNNNGKGWNYKGCQVVFKIKMIFTEQLTDEQQVELYRKNPSANYVDVYYPPYSVPHWKFKEYIENTRSQVFDNEYGEWNFWHLVFFPTTVAHEIGHLMKHSDLYYEEGRVTWVPNQGVANLYKGSMMGERNTNKLGTLEEANVQQYEVDRILDDYKGELHECNSQCCQ